MIFKRENLEKQYAALLQRHGLDDPRPVSKELLDRHGSRPMGHLARRHTEATRREMGDRAAQAERAMFDSELTPGSLFSQIQDYSREIERAIKRLRFHLRTRVFAGEFPTGSFNAQAVPVKGGALLLINTGLMMFIHQITNILMASMAIGAGEEEVLEPALGMDASIDAIFGVLTCYFCFGDSTFAPPSPALSFTRNLIAGGLLVHTEKFALAHEYGHAIAGHLDSNRTILVKMPLGSLELVEKHWSQELEADALAMQILLGVLPGMGLEGGTGIPEVDAVFQLYLETTITAPFYFFELDMLITEVIKHFAGVSDLTIICDHPPSTTRAQMLKESLAKNVAGISFGFADGFAKWVSIVREERVGFNITMGWEPEGGR